MSKVEFRFVVTGVDLPQEVQESIGRAIAEAGALALAEHAPVSAVTVPLPNNVWWRGRPAADVLQALEGYATREVAAQGQ